MEGLISELSPALVFFDLETSGFGSSAEILQIAMSSDSMEFNRYINSRGPIHFYASQVHNLYKGPNNELYRVYGDVWRKLPTLPQRTVLKQMLIYLETLFIGCGGPRLLVAHNCPFDSSHLISAIMNEGLEKEFGVLIDGFTDTLSMFKKKFPERKSKGALKLETLAAELGLSIDGAHDGMVDANLLEVVALEHFTANQLVENSNSFACVVERERNRRITATYKSQLIPLEGLVSDRMISRIASFKISYDMLNDAYRQGGDVEATALLEQRVDGKPQLIKTKKILNIILNHLRERNPSIQG